MKNPRVHRHFLSAACWALGCFLVILSLQAENATKGVTAVPPAVVPAVNPDGYLVVGFDQLASFPYTPAELKPANDKTPAAAVANQIPDKIRALDTKKVAVTGFMLPVKMDQGLVSEFLLVKDPMLCCYGIMPKLNEWVVVKMVGKGVPPLMDIPISFEGKLKVGEMYDNGYLTGIYLLEGERQAESKKG